MRVTGASAALALVFVSATAQTQTSYTADWSSVDQHPPAAEWFQDAKLGIWFHWGAHTTPQFYGEWYRTTCMTRVTAEVATDLHRKRGQDYLGSATKLTSSSHKSMVLG
jgi:hypothetical protein